MDTDEILEEIGSFGYFQKRNTSLLGLIIFVLTFQTVSMVFIGGEPMQHGGVLQTVRFAHEMERSAPMTTFIKRGAT